MPRLQNGVCLRDYIYWFSKYCLESYVTELPDQCMKWEWGKVDQTNLPTTWETTLPKTPNWNLVSGTTVRSRNLPVMIRPRIQSQWSMKFPNTITNNWSTMNGMPQQTFWTEAFFAYFYLHVLSSVFMNCFNGSSNHIQGFNSCDVWLYTSGTKSMVFFFDTPWLGYFVHLSNRKMFIN